MPVLPPSEAAIDRCGSIWASAPKQVSIMRKPVSPRAAEAAGSTPLAMEQPQERLLGDMTGGELGAEVAEHADGHADVLLEEPEERLVRLAAVVHLHGRDAEAFLVDLRGVRRVRARHAAAHVGLVAD